MGKNKINNLFGYYLIKPNIEKRLFEFKELWAKGSEEDIFAELCFCLCTPQAKAREADKAIKALRKNRFLFSGTSEKIKKYLKGVRFLNNKAKYIYEARKFLTEKGKIQLRKRININDLHKTRDWLVKNIKGFGYKEASHFLRNIGFGEKIAILDRHILKNLLRLKVIKEIPNTITPRFYKEIENKLIKYSGQMNIPPDHLDLLFWHEEAGEIFK